MNVRYFDNFEIVRISQKEDICPKNAIQIYYYVKTECHKIWRDELLVRFNEKITHLIFDTDFGHSIKHIPVSVTHLTLNRYFHYIERYIPHSITHLIIGDSFHGSFLSNIPLSVTHLTLGSGFFIQAKKYIPSVTHLTLRMNINYLLIKDIIPETVTHLTLDTDINRPIGDEVPLSVIEIAIRKEYCGNIDTNVLSRVKIVRI